VLASRHSPWIPTAILTFVTTPSRLFVTRIGTARNGTRSRFHRAPERSLSTCSVAVSADGIPHVTWYQERTAEDTNFLHLRHAVLQDGQWLAKTIDWDAQTGKWHSMVLDKQGTPRVSFDAFVSGQLKYGIWVSGSWKVKPIDSRTSSQQPGRGMGIV